MKMDHKDCIKRKQLFDKPIVRYNFFKDAKNWVFFRQNNKILQMSKIGYFLNSYLAFRHFLGKNNASVRDLIFLVKFKYFKVYYV